MFMWLVGGFVVMCVLGFKIIYDAKAEDKRRPRPKKRQQLY